MVRGGVAALLVVAALWAAPARALEGLQPGMKAPTLALEALGGGRLGLGDFPAARAFLLVFWADWSAKSPEALERAEKLWLAWRSRGLVVLGINVESPSMTADEVRAVKARAGRLGLSFPVLLDRGLAAFAAYGVVAVPSSVLVGADGTVLAALAAYPIAGREEFFELVESTVSGRPLPRRAAPQGPQPNPRAVRYFNLARSLLARGLPDPAAADLRRAIELDATFALPRILLGQLYRERALAQEAVQHAGGTAATVHVPPGERERLLREAQALLDEAVRLDPASPAALTELAILHRARGDGARARGLVERALGLSPDYAFARSLLGALLLGAGEAERGRAELAAAIQLNPVDWRLWITAAEAHQERGEARDAAAAYRRGVELLWQARQRSGREPEAQ